MDDKLHKALKLKALNENTDMTKLIREALERLVKEERSLMP